MLGFRQGSSVKGLGLNFGLDSMQGNTEFKEGKACCYSDFEKNFDLDSLSYIDEKIQRVLGHFQKDFFEVAVSAEHLGPQFGGYGSFLPTCARSHPFQSFLKSPQSHFSSPKSPNNLQMEVAFHNKKTPFNMPPSMRLGTASCGVRPFHGLKEPSESGISSNAKIEKCTSSSKDNCVNKSERLTDQGKLKLRIKVKSDILAKKNAKIYSDLGLDDSPSFPRGTSPVESEEMEPASQEIPEESPTNIVQGMTSFTIRGGVLISPLDDSLLSLIRDEKVLRDRGCMSSLNGHQVHSSVSTDQSDSFLRDKHFLKMGEVRVVGQSEKQYIDGNFSDNDMALHTEKVLGSTTPDCRDFLINDLKCTPLSSSICDVGEAAEVTGKAFEVSREVNKDGVECKMDSIEAVKEDSMESISGQDFDKIEKQNTGNSLLQKNLDHRQKVHQNNDSIDPENNGKYNAFMISIRAEGDAVKYNVDQDNQKHETYQKAKAKFEGKKKLKGEWSHGKVTIAAAKDNSRAIINNVTVINIKNAGTDVTCKNKMHKITSVIANKAVDSLKGKKLEQKVDGIGQANGPPANKATMNAKLDIDEKSANRVEVKERQSNNKMVNQLLAGPCLKDASGVLPIAENKPIPESIPPPVQEAPQLIKEDWVCCDSCEKWRLLPMGLKPELPDKWLCSMLYWLPGMNRCDISEEETTKALYTLYQMPISEGQNNVQSHATEPETGVSSADALQFGLSHKKSSSDVISDLGKKKHGIKEKEKKKHDINGDMCCLSNTARNNVQEYGKDRSLIDMNQQAADSFRMNKSSSIHLSRLNNLIEEKNMSNKKEKEINGGDRNHVKSKHKVDSNKYRYGTHKKSQTEDVCYADGKRLSPDMDFEKVGLNSRNGLPENASGKHMRACDQYCSSRDLQNKLAVPVKGEQTQFFSNAGLLDVKNSSKNGSIKKRKLSDRLGDEKHYNTLSMVGDMRFGEESNVSGFRREKKLKVFNTEEKAVAEDDDILSKKSGMKRFFMPYGTNQIAFGTEVKKSVDKVEQPRKLRKYDASYQALDCADSLGKYLAATSSSYKVLGSHKAKTNLEDVRGSPVESVTPPLRTSNMDKLILAAGDTSEKYNSRKGGLYSTSSSRTLDNKDAKPSKKMNEKILYNKHPSQRGVCANDSHHEEKVNKNNLENALSWQKTSKVTSLRVKEMDRRSGSEVSRDNTRVSASENGFPKTGVNYKLALNPNYHASGTEKNSSRQLSNEAGKQNEVKQDFANSVPKLDASCSTNRKTISHQNLIQDLEEEKKANPLGTGLRDWKAKVLSYSEDEAKREISYVDSITSYGSPKKDISYGHPVHARNYADASCKVGVNHSLGNFVPNGQLCESSPLETNSSQTAYSILEEAKRLMDSADHYKNSGFEFESNETYFKAALTYLHGASLLENCYGASTKHGKMSQMQIYATTAKLFESCAHKYYGCQEMAAATLAYKCMEVAYMRLVYCKHSGINRDQNELQSTLEMVSQGASPSSSAFDIDNLNNMVVADNANLPRGANTHVANNQVLSAQNRPNIVRLLDFTRDVNFAMEASRKCRRTFIAANSIMGEAHNRDCINSIRKVVDFSFQDVAELVRLVFIATKAITCAGLGGARD